MRLVLDRRIIFVIISVCACNAWISGDICVGEAIVCVDLSLF